MNFTIFALGFAASVAFNSSIYYISRSIGSIFGLFLMGVMMIVMGFSAQFLLGENLAGAAFLESGVSARFYIVYGAGTGLVISGFVIIFTFLLRSILARRDGA